MAETKQTEQKFSVVHAGETEFRRNGLRPQFEYRDLGINAATGGRYNAHVIRGTKLGEPPIGLHEHTSIDFQMVYILKGWMKFRYEGEGEVRVESGACILQPPGIRHAVLDWSEDLELIEITSPADFTTEMLSD